VVLILAYQSFGVVYGDLSISPLYVFRSTFSGDLKNHVTEDEIWGVLSLIFWTFTLIPVVKYALIVLSADDNGEGGYSKRHNHPSEGATIFQDYGNFLANWQFFVVMAKTCTKPESRLVLGRATCVSNCLKLETCQFKELTVSIVSIVRKA